MAERTRTLRVGQRGGTEQDPAMVPGMLVLHGEYALPRTRAFGVAGKTTIGRHADCDVSLDDIHLSRCHAIVRSTAEGLRVRDDDSHNGTFVDGVALSRGLEVALPFGAVVRCGTTLLLAIKDVTSYARWPASANRSPLVGGALLGAARQRLEILGDEGHDVLLVGETGTGKEVAARLVHARSGHGPFVALNCAELPPSLFEAELFGARRGAYTGADVDRAGLIRAARGGTLFLDEIGELPAAMQAKLLRVVEQREVRAIGADRGERIEFRLICATHRDLRAECAAGRFRSDLYYRLGVATVELPPLRERRDDVVVLLERLVRDAPIPLNTPFVERLLLHDWPGNVRELERVVSEARLEARVQGQDGLRASHLPSTVGVGRPDVELARIREALQLARGNVSQAATALDLSRSRLYSLLRTHRLRPEDFRH